MAKPKYMHLVDKSRAACISAIETYNRASAMYREETFAILMINAWELLLKARVMRENAGKVNAIYEFKPRKKKDGSSSKLKEIKLTRSGAAMTVGIDKCWKLVSGYPVNNVDTACVANIEALLEIRDNATHFVATDPVLRKKLAEISLAAVKNYVIAAQKWFSISFSDLNIASIPISFDLDQKEVEAVAKKSSHAVAKFVSHMQKLEAESSRANSDFSFSIRIDFDLIKKKDDGAVKAAIVGASDAEIKVVVESDNVPAGFDWTYEALLKKLNARYTNFKQNAEFHALMAKVKNDKKLYYERYLDPVKKKGGKKGFLNPNVLSVFDENYTRIGATLFETEPE